VQSDRMRFAETWRIMLEETENVHFFQDMVTGLLVKNDKVVGVRTGLGVEFRAKAVVLTNGTFLNGLIHIGEKQFGGGRAGERAATGITEDLLRMGFESGRMKTGTPPRVDGRSLDYSKMEEQKGDVNPEKFSFTDTKPITEQRSCFITYTSDEVHDILRSGFDRSPMFNGAIQSTGPRYCPSIEDKIHRFADRNRHQIFVEPEGWNTVEIYVNGFSTSLPEDVQLEALRKMKGFEQARIFRPGYAIEYDYFPPIQLSHSLQTKLIENLFFAGQINGTTGYEEAGAQGLMAGINAHLKVHGGAPFVLKRSDAYIGVLIDDLITKGTEEPYRMFTSRAEYRILLRQDNADIRLTRLSNDIGLASKEAVARVEEKERQMALASKFVATHNFTPEDINPVLEAQKSAPLSVKKRISEVLARPQIQIDNLLSVEPLSSFQQAEKINTDAWVQTEIHHKYKGYIERERENADKLTRLEDVRIPNELDYHSLQSLSAESREKLARIRPTNIGQAKRISGVSPSDTQVLLVYLGR